MLRCIQAQIEIQIQTDRWAWNTHRACDVRNMRTHTEVYKAYMNFTLCNVKHAHTHTLTHASMFQIPVIYLTLFDSCSIIVDIIHPSC